MSDTPQTDQAEASALEVGQWHLAKLSRQLERENAELRARLKESEGWRSVGDRLNDRLKAEIVALVASARKEAQP